nr:preprotein translocase subunit YajC [Tissierella sp.]
MTPQQMSGLIVPIGFLVIFYLFVIRPQKKKEKEIRSMRDSLKVGDEVITIGGIYGKVLLVKEDKLTLEIGNTKTRLDVTRWAVGSVISNNDIK